MRKIAYFSKSQLESIRCGYVYSRYFNVVKGRSVKRNEHCSQIFYQNKVTYIHNGKFNKIVKLRKYFTLVKFGTWVKTRNPKSIKKKWT